MSPADVREEVEAIIGRCKVYILTELDDSREPESKLLKRYKQSKELQDTGRDRLRARIGNSTQLIKKARARVSRHGAEMIYIL